MQAMHTNRKSILSAAAFALILGFIGTTSPAFAADKENTRARD